MARRRRKRLPVILAVLAALLLVLVPAGTSGEGEVLTAEALAPAELPEETAAPEQKLDAAEPVPAAEPPQPVDDTYFADAVFLGDSRTEGLRLYGGLENGTFLYAVGATVESVFTKKIWPTASGKVPLLDALEDTSCGKVYLMLGINELGWVYPEVFQEQCGKVVDRIQADHPEAAVAIQSILPVSAEQEAKGTYVNNGRIALYNDLLEELAAEKGCAYLDIAAALADEAGLLPQELTLDGVHLNTRGCEAWLDYLRLHPLEGAS